MRIAVGVALLAALAVGGPKEERYKKLGGEQLARLEKAKGNQAKLKVLRKARYWFQRAKADAELVKVLNRETAIYYARKSLPLASKRNAAALKLAPKDETALKLKAAIEKARDKDIYESVDGAVGIDRVRSRRMAAGVPLRDRGLARRR